LKVLVIGSGGREHALAWKLAQSPAVERVYAAPGNGGTALEPKCRNVPVPGGDPATPEAQTALATFARKQDIALTLVGPEVPLAAGIVDTFRAAGLAIVGPDARAARLESSKSYSKDFMRKYGVRAAASRDFDAYAPARDWAARHFSAATAPRPLVVKADGLAAGKGVVVATGFAEADAALRSFMLDRSLGTAGGTVLLEEFLAGQEVSVLAAVSGGVIVPFVPARDHKRRFDGGAGPNTGGMGAIAPVPDFSPEAIADFISGILEPTARGIQAEGFDYRGFIFFGLMVDDDRCSLLEYNVRLGDPETQAVLPLMDSDLAALCGAILDGTLADFPLRWKPGAVCAPVAVADGYPGSYRRGDPIEIDHPALAGTNAQVFMAGASLDADALACGMGPGATEAGVLRSSGGRVLTVSAWGRNGAEARDSAYRALGGVRFSGMGYRTDIGRFSG